MSTTTRRIQRDILNYASLALILVAFLISFIVIYPMSQRLKWYEEQNVGFARDTASLVLSDFIEHLSEVSQYLANHMNFATIAENQMKEDLAVDDDLVGLGLIDKNGQISTEVGLDKLPKKLITNWQQSPKQRLFGPFQQNKSYSVYLFTQLKKGKGHNFLLTKFDLRHLEDNLHKKLSSRLGQLVVAYITNRKISVFSPKNTSLKEEAWQNDTSLHVSLLSAIEKTKRGFMEGQVLGKPSIIAFSPVRDSDWGVAVIIDRDFLFASIWQVVTYLLITVFVIVALFLFGLNRTLKPLSGKLILHADVLEAKIKAANADLQKANEALSLAARIDPLTQILNRRGLDDKVASLFSRLKRHDKGMLLLYIDVNKFKAINDTMGHDAGDAVLIEISQRLKACIRQEDVLARLGGDEFIVIIPDFEPKDAAVISKKLKDACVKPIEFKAEVIETSISVGSALFPQDGDAYESLLNVADSNMYQDKHVDK